MKKQIHNIMFKKEDNKKVKELFKKLKSISCNYKDNDCPKADFYLHDIIKLILEEIKMNIPKLINNEELYKIVITENLPENKWTIEYNSFNSKEAVEIPEKLAKAILNIKKENKESLIKEFYKLASRSWNPDNINELDKLFKLQYKNIKF